MAKDKKKKVKKDGAGKGGGKAAKAATRLKTISENPMVADIVAAALVATAAALKDSKKARRLAEQAGDELSKLSKKGAEQGSALWELALDIGRRSIKELSGAGASKEPKPKPKPKPKAGSKAK